MRKFTIEERATRLAHYIIETKDTVRSTAKKFGVSKSTVHKDITLQNGLKIGQVIPVEECKNINKTVNQMLNDKLKYKERINKLYNESMYNIGKSAEIGANYIINTIQEKINKRKKEK